MRDPKPAHDEPTAEDPEPAHEEPTAEHPEAVRDEPTTEDASRPNQAPRRQRIAPAALVTLVLLAGLWAVWAWQYGGWFGTALYPGTVVLAIGVVLLALFAPLRPRLRGWPTLALGGLIGLGFWAALSALWSPSPDVAIEDGQRILTYAMAFLLGAWLCTLLGTRPHLAMAPFAFAGLFAAVLTVGRMLGADELRVVLENGTLQYPVGYRNANAAFFLTAMWPALGLAATPKLTWWLRGISLGTATLCLELGMLSQSRGSLIAGGVALVVWVLASKQRARAVLWLVLAVAPALIVVPALTDLYDAAGGLGRQQTLEDLHTAGQAAAIGAGVAVGLGLVAALVSRRFPASERTVHRANRAVAVGAVGLAVAGAAAFVVVTGDPVQWLEDRAEEFQNSGTPNDAGASSRFAFNAGTERDDLWRVALEGAREDPLLGTGAGGFYYGYLRGRSEEGVESARDAHSVELETLGELGVPGLLLLALALVGAVAGAVRARRFAPSAAALSACALTAAAYLLVHSSIDWFWPFPGLTAPMLALLGSACTPAIARARGRTRGRSRWWPAGGAILLALSVIPAYLSERYVNQAFQEWPEDRARAYEDLDRAAALNPLSEEPLMAEGGIARAADDDDRAIEAFERAAAKRPEEWAIHYFLAQLYLDRNPARAERELEIAANQNPLSPTIIEARRQLGRQRSPAGG